MMRLSKYLLFTASILASTPALADDGDAIVVTAARAAKPLSEIGQSISVITRENIETRQAVAVVDLLRARTRR